MTVIRTRADENMISSSRGAFYIFCFFSFCTIFLTFWTGGRTGVFHYGYLLMTIFFLGLWLGIRGTLKKLKIYERESLDERDS